MERIRLNVEREFVDLFAATFRFVQQEVKPFLRAFAAIVLPVLVLMAIVMQVFIMLMVGDGKTDIEALSSLVMIRFLVKAILMAFLGFWIQLFVLSYLRVYRERGEGGGASGIGVGEVFGVMRRRFWPFLAWGVVYGLMTVVGFACLIVPGVWLGVALWFGGYFVVMEDDDVRGVFARSWALVKGHWWMSFGYGVVWWVICWVVMMVFGLPYGLLSMLGLTIGAWAVWLLMFVGLLIVTVGQYIAYPVMALGGGFLFTSLQEARKREGKDVTVGHDAGLTGKTEA